MEAQAWTARGLRAATLLGALFYLGKRIDSMGREARFAEQCARFEDAGQFNVEDARIDALVARMDALATRVEGQLAQLVDGIYQVALKMDDHLRRHAS